MTARAAARIACRTSSRLRCRRSAGDSNGDGSVTPGIAALPIEQSPVIAITNSVRICDHDMECGRHCQASARKCHAHAEWGQRTFALLAVVGLVSFASDSLLIASLR